MKQSRLAILMSIVLIPVFLFLLVSCGSAPAEQTPPSTAGDTQAAGSTAAASTEEVIDPLGKQNPEVDFTSVAADPGVTYKWAANETIDNNPWIKAYKDYLGINLKYNWVVPLEQYDQKLGIAIASNDLPDFLRVDMKNLNLLVENDMLADLTDVYDKYASPLSKEIMSGDGGTALKTATFKGKLMALPEVGSMLDASQMIWIRNDWLKNLNLAVPKTIDELLKAAQAFVEQDPDGNKESDTTGICIAKGAISPTNYQGEWGYANLIGLCWGYHAYIGSWIKDASGNLVYGSIQPEMKTALAKFNELYKSKVFDPEFGVKEMDKATEALTAGKVGIQIGQMWNSIAPLQNSKTQDPKADWIPIPIVSADDKPAMNCLSVSVGKYLVVNKNCKNPEAVIKIANLFTEQNWGTLPAFETFRKEISDIAATGEEIFKLSMFQVGKPTQNLDMYVAICDAINTKDTSKLAANVKTNVYDKVIAYMNGDIPSYGLAGVYGPGGSQGICKQYMDNNQVMMNEFYGAPTPTMTEKLATLQKIESETFTKIIMGKIPVNEFDNFVTQWKQLGGDQITKEVNDWYRSKE